MSKPVAETITTGKIGNGILILIGLSGLAYGGLKLWKFGKRVFYSVASWTGTAVETGITLIAILMAIFMLCFLLDLLILPIFRAIRRRLAENAAIKQSVYPTLNTFRGVQNGTVLDRVFTGYLAPIYLEVMGRWPSRDSFKNNPGEFHLFRGDQLPKLVRGQYRYNFELMFRQVQAAYAGGNEKLKTLLSPLIAAQCRCASTLRLTGRFLNILTFGVLGYKNGAGYVVVEESVWAGDWNNFRALMMRHFFPMAKAIENCGVEFEGDETADVVPELVPQLAAEPIRYQETPLLSEATVVCESPVPESMSDAVIDSEEDDTDAVNTAELEQEAVETVDTVMGFFENFRDKAWQKAAQLMERMISLLNKASAYHPEPALVFSRIVWIEHLKTQRLPLFEDSYESVRQLSADADLPGWFQSALSNMGTELMDEATFRQCCLVYFLLSEPEKLQTESADNEPERCDEAVVQSIGF